MTDQNILPEEPKPINDLSPRVVHLARMIDRLPAGEFEITITKPEIRAGEWDVSVVRREPIQHLTLPRSFYRPE